MGSGEMSESSSLPLQFMLVSGAATLCLATALAYVIMKSGKRKDVQEAQVEEEEVIILDRAEYPGGHLSIYYGSQTGTAESFANDLQREGVNHGFYVHVIDLEDINPDRLLDEARRDDKDQPAKAVFLCSTYGEGEPTDNSAAFVMELKARLCMSDAGGGEVGEEKKEEHGAGSSAPDQSLVGLEYSVFGLGNRQYEHYNAMGKFFDVALEKIGGKRIMEIGLGDDDADLEGDFESWKDTVLWPNLKKLYVKDGAVPVHKKAQEDELPDCPFVVEYVNQQKNSNKIALDHVHSSSRHYFTAVDCPVSVVKELRTKEDPGSTVHMEIDISKAKKKDLSYQTADNLGVLPINSPSVVEDVAKSLSFDLEAAFLVKNAPHHEWHGTPFPAPITIRECLSRYCDLTSAPRRSDLKLLASYAKDPTDKKALLRMSSKEGRAEYKEKILQQHVGLVDILKLCPSIEAPLEHFLSFCSHMVPRYYTISSSSSVHPKSVHLTVAVTETTKPNGSIHKGVCSSYLAESQKKQMVRVFCRPSTFRLPEDPSRPILMIGPGTGIAPMRALLQEREYQRDSLKKSIGRNVLYFGCKSKRQDYIYQDELVQFQKKGVLQELHLAFSREQKEKVYVQHLLARNAKDTWELVDSQGAYIYVCGGVKMGNDVHAALQQICELEGGLAPSDAKAYLDTLASKGRFIQELWA